jgi:hypothetical protein
MLSLERTHRPELLPRQGERNAWLFALLASLALGLLHLQGVVPVFSWIFVIFLLVSALSISLGNWMDRRTVLRLADDGVAFENGLRRVSLTWSQISEVRIRPTRWGEQIQVIGEQSHFSFNTLGSCNSKARIAPKLALLRDRKSLKKSCKPAA